MERQTYRELKQTQQPDRVRPGRQLAIIRGTRTREKGFIFARSVGLTPREEYFVHVSGVGDERLFESLQEGDGISLRVNVTTKGIRGFDVQRATEIEQGVIDNLIDAEMMGGGDGSGEEEGRGNR